MSALALSCLIFVLTPGGILLGTLLRRALPEHHLNENSQDVVRLGVGLIATIAALVLGLLIAAAKSSFDTQSTQVKQITADMILLDNLLAEYGPEARPIREQMRSIIGPLADRLWREKQANTVSFSSQLAMSADAATPPPAPGRFSTITACFSFACRLFTLAESLGGVESLISLPAPMTHASTASEVRASLGITDTLIRISVGIEDAEDLIADLKVALS